MAPAEPAPKASISVATEESIDWRNISKTKRTHVLRPKTQEVSGNSKPQPAKPLTKKARRFISMKTEKLMRKRDELDQVVLSQASRPLRSLKAIDWLLRENILIQCEQLTRREGRYVQTITRALAERTRLHKWDPSAERAVDLDLIRQLLWKFSQHLGPHLVEAEKPKADRDDGISSSGPDLSSDEAEATSSSSSDDDGHTLDNDINSPGDVGSEDQGTSAIDGLDGAFDDTIASKKRKAVDLIVSGKEPHKKAKSEQTGSEQSDTPIAPQMSQGMEGSIATIKAEINIMSRTKMSTLDGNIKEKADRKTKETTTLKSASDNGSLTPFYKLHAKAMVHPEFNDHVHDRPPHRRGYKRPSNRPIKEYKVRGALPDPHPPGPKRHLKGDQGSSPTGRP